MTLTRQLLLLTAAVLGVTALLLIAGLSVVLLRSFNAIEQAQVEKDLHAIIGTYQRELDALDTIARDWAWWDDSSAFVTTTNSDFIASSLNYETLQQLDVDVLGYFHENGDVIWAVRHDRVEKRLEPMPLYILDTLALATHRFEWRTPTSGVKGLAQTPDNPLMVVVRQILQSDQSEPAGPRAFFLIGRFLDSHHAAQWARILNVDIEVFPHDSRAPRLNACHVPGEQADQNAIVHAWAADKKQMMGCIILSDLENNPILCLRMTRPRDIYLRARITLFHFVVTIAITASLALMALFFAVRHFVVAPVQQLSLEIENMARGLELDQRVAVPEHRELASLAETVNHLVASLHRAEQERQKHTDRLEKLNRCLLGFGTDPLKNIASLVQVTGELLGADWALYNRLQSDMLCTLSDWHAPEDLPRTDAPAGHICSDVIAKGEGRPLVIRDLQHSPYAETDPNVRKYGLKTYVGYPVYRAGQAIGSLCCVYTRDVEISDNDRKLLGIVAAALSVEEERLEAVEQLRESREEWRRTFDLIPDPVCIIDEHFVVQRANAAMLRTLGLPEEKIIGRTCYESVHACGAVPEFCPHAKVLETGEQHTAEILEEKMGGEYLVTCSPIRNGEGRVVGSVHIARDVRVLKERERQIGELLAESDQNRKALLSILEDQRRVEMALRESEARFRALLSLLPETIFECDVNGRLTFVNDFGLKQFGYTQEDLAHGITLKDVVVPEQHGLLEQNLHKRLEGERGIHEYLMVRPDGSVFPGAADASPIFRDGQIVGLRGICIDLTEHKKVEELRIAKEAAEQINRAKSEFLAIMSHELRTPLHTIAGFAKAMEEGVYGPPTEAQQETLRHITQAAEHLMQLISDILDMSRIEIGRVELALDKIPVVPLVRECIELVRGRDDAAELHFSYKIAPEIENTLIRADPRRLRQVLLNLLSNSLKFSLPSGRITITVTPDPGDSQKIRFGVEDEGVGVKPDELEKIFERFQRGSPPDGRWREGVGLGLALAKELVQLHGGHIWAEPGDGQRGLRVYFVLPIAGPGETTSKPKT